MSYATYLKTRLSRSCSATTLVIYGRDATNYVASERVKTPVVAGEGPVACRRDEARWHCRHGTSLVRIPGFHGASCLMTATPDSVVALLLTPTRTERQPG